MEDVLDVYQMPRDPDVALVCLDEASKQLLQDSRRQLAAAATAMSEFG